MCLKTFTNQTQQIYIIFFFLQIDKRQARQSDMYNFYYFPSQADNIQCLPSKIAKFNITLFQFNASVCTFHGLLLGLVLFLENVLENCGTKRYKSPCTI